MKFHMTYLNSRTSDAIVYLAPSVLKNLSIN